jgi:hypothetical protein
LLLENYYLKSLTGWIKTSDAPLSDRENDDMLQKGKEILAQFDIIVITEWLDEESTKKHLGYLLSVTSSLPSAAKSANANNIMTSSKRLVVGNVAAKSRLAPELMFDKENVLTLLRKINRWDIKLFKYAKELVAARILATNKLTDANLMELSGENNKNATEKIVQKEVNTFWGTEFEYSQTKCPIGNGQVQVPIYTSRKYGFHPRMRRSPHHADKSLPTEFRSEIGLFQIAQHKGPVLENLY